MAVFKNSDFYKKKDNRKPYRNLWTHLNTDTELKQFVIWMRMFKIVPMTKMEAEFLKVGVSVEVRFVPYYKDEPYEIDYDKEPHSYYRAVFNTGSLDMCAMTKDVGEMIRELHAMIRNEGDELSEALIGE